MKLIIVRHGETIENEAGVIQGNEHGKLSKLGLEQAKKLGIALKNTKIDFIYSSDLGRTKETVREIIKHHPDVPVVYDPLLRERNYGEFEGRKIIDVRKEIGDEKTRLVEYVPKGGESAHDHLKRVESFVEYLFKNHQRSETILICTHGGWKQVFYRLLKKLPPDKYINNFKFDNASISTVNINNDMTYRFIHINRTRHL